MTIASIVVSVTALLFTVTSFWWLQARRGRLSCFPAPSFSGFLQPHKSAIRIPLSVFNSGAVPIVITDLRLRMQTPSGELTLHFNTFRKSLSPEEDDVQDFAHPYSVPGRSVVSRHVEFMCLRPPVPLIDGNPATAVVEALLDHKDTWTELGRFPLHVEIMAAPARYITYGNQTDLWSANRGAADAAFAELRQRMGVAGHACT